MPQLMAVVAAPLRERCCARRVHRGDEQQSSAAQRLPEIRTGEETPGVPNDNFLLNGPVRCWSPPKGVGPVRRGGEAPVLPAGNGSAGAFGYVRVPSLWRDLTSASEPPPPSGPRCRALR